MTARTMMVQSTENWLPIDVRGLEPSQLLEDFELLEQKHQIFGLNPDLSGTNRCQNKIEPLNTDPIEPIP